MGHDKDRSGKLGWEGLGYRAEGIETASGAADYDYIAARRSFARIGCHILSLRIPSSPTVGNSSGLGSDYQRGLDTSVPLSAW
jgi:hypothetical protein